MVTEKDARSLAICYEAFCDARNRGNAPSMRVWAHQLVIRQDATGIELVRRARLVALYESVWGDPERGVAPTATAEWEASIERGAPRLDFVNNRGE